MFTARCLHFEVVRAYMHLAKESWFAGVKGWSEASERIYEVRI